MVQQISYIIDLLHQPLVATLRSPEVFQLVSLETGGIQAPDSMTDSQLWKFYASGDAKKKPQRVTYMCPQLLQG